MEKLHQLLKVDMERTAEEDRFHGTGIAGMLYDPPQVYSTLRFCGVLLQKPSSEALDRPATVTFADSSSLCLNFICLPQRQPFSDRGGAPCKNIASTGQGNGLLKQLHVAKLKAADALSHSLHSLSGPDGPDIPFWLY